MTGQAPSARPLPMAALAACLIATALAGCATGDRPDVMATFYPLQYLTQRVAGDGYTVESVVEPGTEPHEYQLTPTDVQNVNKAKLLVIQGANFEGWTDNVDQKNVVTASRGIALLENPEEEERDEVPQDPHTWLDPVFAQAMVRNIQQGLANTFPEDAGNFKANADRLVEDLQQLHTEFEAGLADCRKPIAITNHAAFAYMAERYGFTMIAISGLAPDAEPSAQTIKEVQDKAKEHGVKVIFFEDLVEPRVVNMIAENVGAQTRVLSPVEAIVPGTATEGKDYFGVMRMNLENLREGLECA
jgi:zinc transport system substrate-binding protein